MNWLERIKTGLTTRTKREVPDGIWSKCPRCGHANYQAALERQRWICPECDCHYPLRSDQYVRLLTDPDSFTELDPRLTSTDPLRFRDTKRYADRLKASRKESGMQESVLTGIATIGGHPVALGVMDTRFIMGTLGSATGEKLARMIDRAMVDRRAVIIICQSGGARMMEGTLSLMQMAKVSAKLGQLAQAGLLYITLLTDPTYGGVTASFGMLGDVIISEPGARVGFAGQSVIKQFLGTEALPEGFQVAETVLRHGFVDRIVRRDHLPAELARIIALLSPATATPVG